MRFILYTILLSTLLSASYNADAYIIARVKAQSPSKATIQILGDAHTPTQLGKQQFKQLSRWFEDNKKSCYAFLESCPWETYTKGYTDVTLRDMVVFARKHSRDVAGTHFIEADGRSRETVRVQFMCVSLWHALFKTGYNVTPELTNYPNQLNEQLTHYGPDISKQIYIQAINRHIAELEKGAIDNVAYNNRLATIKKLRDIIIQELAPCGDSMSMTNCFSHVLQKNNLIQWESSIFNACIQIDTYIADAYFIKYLYDFKNTGYPLIFIVGQAHLIALKQALEEMKDCMITDEFGLTSHIAQSAQECIAIDIQPCLTMQSGEFTLFQWIRSWIAMILSPFI